jgi:hypothetical protein
MQPALPGLLEDTQHERTFLSAAQAGQLRSSHHSSVGRTTAQIGSYSLHLLVNVPQAK